MLGPTSGDLFGGEDAARIRDSFDGAPLAERMRPLVAEEFVGQRHLLGPGKLLRRLLDRGEPTSLILWGPPGVGKTTLARLFASTSGVRFTELSATSTGVKQLREAASIAEQLCRATGQRTLLFIDEIHRFHKGQQDALLPWVESGAVYLVGATTENPSFEIVAPLLSRCRVVRLESIASEDLCELLRRTLETPPPRGLAAGGLRIASTLLEQIALAADGDARSALNALELAVLIATGNNTPGTEVEITEDMVREALQRRHLRYDREEHFSQVSALQKSIRNSDPDASLYWLARLLQAGEDPKYVARRLIRVASEDIGLADPRALELAVAGLRAFEVTGLPEGALALAEVTVYLAGAPKSDAVYRAYTAAVAEIESSGNLPVPMQLRNAVTSLMREEGYGEGYQHAHDQPDAVTTMDCMPERLRGRQFYRPTDRGIEARIATRLAEREQLRREGRGAAPATERPSSSCRRSDRPDDHDAPAGQPEPLE